MMRSWGRIAAPLALLAAGLLACDDVVTDPDAVAALDFDGIAFPAVVSGDTLRDGSGVATPLAATVYDGRGGVIADAPVEFFALDTGVTIDANGFLTAARRSGPVRLVASVNGLQSQRRTVQVTPRPDTVRSGATDITFTYNIPDSPPSVSPALSLTLQSRDTVGGGSPGVAGWIVRWRIVHQGDTLAPTDTSKVALWPAAASRHGLLDTTRADGTVSRRLRVYANLLPVQPDSFIVIAELRARGMPVPGSPLRYVVHIRPPSI
ncbi:hypothetical protein Strain138_000578 [Pseudogemmatithrix spongiicola]|uniref:Big-1 domain-containing protein n=1 Tax=Pseudogemmatithrix spongiicola TaxID=3062599 RepID=A0AA49Q3X8_9BACT|nr:hypothetical protein Strain138_000578 [Gemmatimonadaceae bacterium 'strain 138']WKW14246.1 hypothetical protein Strain318_000578 [Gemmatimonadaceae bacterium 'strain 318']